jgi:thioredoxin-dependent peroxiredoxin
MTGRILAITWFALALSPSRLLSQEPVKIRLTGNPTPGTDAPASSLPYFTAEGPGPADQPFTLRAELGRVVVLAFCRSAADSAAVTLLRAFASRRDSLFPGDVAVAAIVPDRGDSLLAVARGKSLQIKLLSDSGQRVRRLFGVDRSATAVYVVGLDGRVAWRELRFNPFLATAYDRLRRAVIEASRLP